MDENLQVVGSDKEQRAVESLSQARPDTIALQALGSNLLVITSYPQAGISVVPMKTFRRGRLVVRKDADTAAQGASAPGVLRFTWEQGRDRSHFLGTGGPASETSLSGQLPHFIGTELGRHHARQFWRKAGFLGVVLVGIVGGGAYFLQHGRANAAPLAGDALDRLAYEAVSAKANAPRAPLRSAPVPEAPVQVDLSPPIPTAVAPTAPPPVPVPGSPNAHGQFNSLE